MYFGMEDPASNAVAGQAACLTLISVPSMLKKPDSECEAEALVNGYRLGGASRIAVYALPATASSYTYTQYINTKCPAGGVAGLSGSESAGTSMDEAKHRCNTNSACGGFEFHTSTGTTPQYFGTSYSGSNCNSDIGWNAYVKSQVATAATTTTAAPQPDYIISTLCMGAANTVDPSTTCCPSGYETIKDIAGCTTGVSQVSEGGQVQYDAPEGALETWDTGGGPMNVNAPGASADSQKQRPEGCNFIRRGSLILSTLNLPTGPFTANFYSEDASVCKKT